MDNYKIVFFDGDCALCNRFIWLTLEKMQLPSTIKFCSQNSDLFRKFKEKYNFFKELDSIVFFDNGKIKIQAEAILSIIFLLKKPWNFIGLFIRFFPKPLLNFGYKFIAIRRKKIPFLNCPLIPKKWKQYFISDNELDHFEQRIFD